MILTGKMRESYNSFQSAVQIRESYVLTSDLGILSLIEYGVFKETTHIEWH